MTRSLPPNRAFLAAVLTCRDEAVIVTDARGRVRWSSRQAGPLLGGRMIDAVHPADRRMVAAAYRSLADQPCGETAVSCRVRHDEQGWISVGLRLANRLGDPRVGGWVTAVSDPLVDLTSAAGLGADRTGGGRRLTGLPDRRALLHHLDDDRRGRIAVISIDLDSFGTVNDTLGRPAGDKLLVLTAARLCRVVRSGDTVARLGGDQFAVVAGEVTGAEAMEIANRLRLAVARPLPFSGRVVRLTASVGVATGEKSQAASLLGDADVAMRRARQSGRDNCMMYASGMREAAAAERTADPVVRPDADEQGISVVYQPVVELASGALTAAEGRLSLAQVSRVPVAAATGRSDTIDHFDDVPARSDLASFGAQLVERACAGISPWAGWPGQVWVALSEQRLRTGHLADDVSAALARSQLRADRLVLQVTERTLAAATTNTWGNLDDLKGIGVGLCVDDFGGGGASLSALTRVQADILRLDRAFLPGLGRDRRDTTVVQAFIALGDSFGLTTAAKGIMTGEQAERLASLGCRLGQGHHIGWPVPAARLLGSAAGPQ